MAILVHLPSFMAVPITALLREQAPDITVWNGREAAVPEEVEAIIAWGLKPGVLPAYPKLRLVCAATAGVDKLLAAPDLPQDMPVTRIVDPGQQTGIAHFVLAMALRHTRELGVYAEQRHRGEWKRHRGRALSRCRVGVLGLGEIGSEVARMFAAIGFPVAGWSRSPKHLPGVADFTGDDGLDAMLAQTDILVCTLPLTPQTNGMLDRKTLARLPQGAYFINVGRGEHVVEADLLALIDEGHLAGAALDVFAKEPPAADDPIWTHPRIEATPHIAADPSYELVAQQCIENLRRARDGRPLLNQVDRHAGY
ncbi:2-hydroxyacid dehydrogenase [Cupriavidus oxalaticus]|uniref:Glyoxylate/hydroxypyruvate reductase A n=1 Tax=Cupriavidus oxalaticus TaxID=96344 RepID=A0ABX7HNG5_9BURK|nr:glyoxylate/hydroxypyruvate reductase A [Cupriavidus oxalaticus]QRQ83916.1 glyoxylate/hydroxypyruvate reductase A [Cupriavidus oxalaticus]QRQ91995.1 glyoxylate/hydroxypyruvate reductase A [Cupriavidus oxalaticus]WQD86587.1 glyoxylate/hydroxypyruvate reductase A [Cupriavidus oxalaticus]